MCFKGSDTFFPLLLHTEQLLQIITFLMVRSAVRQINLHVFCLDILCVGNNAVYVCVYI